MILRIYKLESLKAHRSELTRLSELSTNLHLNLEQDVKAS